MISPFPKSSSVPGEGHLIAKLLPQGTSGLETFKYQYPLKLITPLRPSETESTLVYLLSYGGGLVAGDHVNLKVDVRSQAKLSMVTRGHTKVFTTTSPEIVTRQEMRVSIASEGALCLLPDPVQPFAGSVYEQKQVFRMEEDASLCLLDWVTQGRIARGENWSFVRWIGRNEIWTAPPDEGDGEAKLEKDRLLVRDTVKLDSDKPHPELPLLRDSMHGAAVMGTLLLKGPLMKSLGEFFLAEFATLPRIGARDFRSEAAKQAAEMAKMSPREKWRAERLVMERENKLLWTAAKVRGCVVVKFGARSVEAGRLWVGSMLQEEGSISSHFGDHALICVQ
ncbi:UreD urease accessory protein-domain-containing protein [Triangularia verruculosa]|uniref:UreD urease accessory protein-domain-containing protein n=1 Tax=Triangularia verruculosa TaxID=2587418 RepID=A0AAN6XRK0_9PEZI|nr:UreD urease accessory protein-domain-containing protein [Triangularia verruculosa]